MPGDGENKVGFFQDLNWRLEAVAFKALFAFLRALGVERASGFGGKLLRWLGPLTGTHKTVTRNLRIAFPDMDAGERDRLADALHGIGLDRDLQHLFVFPQIFGEIGLDQARCDAVDPDVVTAPLDSQIARQLHVRRLGHVVSADQVVAAQASDRGNDQDRPVLPLDHLRRDHLGQPVVGQDVVVEDLLELFVGYARHRPRIGVGRRIADQDVDLTPFGVGLVHQPLQVLFRRDIGRNGDGPLLAVLRIDRLGCLVARTGLTRRDHHPRAMFGQPFGDGLADALGRARDDRDLAAQIEQFHASSPPEPDPCPASDFLRCTQIRPSHASGQR